MAVRSWGWGPGVRGPFLAGVGTLGSAPHSRDNPGPLPLRAVLREGVAATRTLPEARMSRWTSGPWGAGWPSRQHRSRAGASLGLLGGGPRTRGLSLLDKQPNAQPQDSCWSPVPAGDPRGLGSPTNRVLCVTESKPSALARDQVWTLRCCRNYQL